MRPVLKKKTFRVVENRCLQCVESILVNHPLIAKFGLKESLKQVLLVFFFTSFWIFWSSYRAFFVSVSFCFTAILSMAAPRHPNVRLEDRVDRGRRSTFVSVNTFF